MILATACRQVLSQMKSGFPRLFPIPVQKNKMASKRSFNKPVGDITADLHSLGTQYIKPQRKSFSILGKTYHLSYWELDEGTILALQKDWKYGRLTWFCWKEANQPQNLPEPLKLTNELIYFLTLLFIQAGSFLCFQTFC